MPCTTNSHFQNYSRTKQQLHLPTKNLFKIDINANKLDQHRAEIFHAFTAKNLFSSQHSHLDTKLTVAFPCTWVKSPDEDDWKKLLWSLFCLHCTKHLHLILEATNPAIVQWWANTAFTVHHDMKSHTGATMTSRKGTIQAISSKQKLNTKSSTEAESVAADNTMSHTLQTKYF